jgi:hypothetical protein
MAHSDTQKTLTEAVALLREGKVQEADDLLSKHGRELLSASGTGAAVSEPAPPPRAPNVILLDFGRELVSHLGSPPALVHLLQEFEASEKSHDAPGEEK